MKLSQKEEQLMNFIWQAEKVYMKDLLDAYPEPKPAATTLATILKRLSNKGAIAYNLHGNLREYYPILQKKDYSSSYLQNMIKTFFQGSSARFASFFTNNMTLSREELLELRNMIDDKLNNEKK
ncbi:BlaI/MecI/CopY family transcriptional regulator [Maribellus maritimus]|uniref:BlaI/MecI/CopY family transcriptional regulator n=1 Tax=Maribellus maritimus TaxID=2870838 RepID=UPI001EEAD580|nr:BlaI/MecI/CopY family transcriptional regulator [Maribellus maritimus]MCG6188576.1 BlaI/MecI/CopY family transcriptional regulator [Maribellus maritimus]